MSDNEWPEPCICSFQAMSRKSPERLIEWMKILPPHHLTFAAEAIGSLASRSSELVASALLELLQHEDRTVREGAICGLNNIVLSLEPVEADKVRSEVGIVASDDPSPAVRFAAMDCLDDWAEV